MKIWPHDKRINKSTNKKGSVLGKILSEGTSHIGNVSF